MIGQIIFFTKTGEKKVATLNDDGLWDSTDHAVSDLLNNRFPVGDYSPSQGVYGRLQVIQASQFFGGSATLATLGKPDPKMVY